MLSIDQRPPGRHSCVAHIAQPPPVPSTRDRQAGLRAEWRRLTRLLEDPDVDLDVETTTALLLCHNRMTAAGIRIDAMAAALVRQLAFQLAASETFLDG